MTLRSGSVEGVPEYLGHVRELTYCVLTYFPFPALPFLAFFAGLFLAAFTNEVQRPPQSFRLEKANVVSHR